jgi:hypothetical protein
LSFLPLFTALSSFPLRSRSSAVEVRLLLFPFPPPGLTSPSSTGYNLHADDGDTIASTIQRRYGETPFRDDDGESEGSDDL